MIVIVIASEPIAMCYVVSQQLLLPKNKKIRRPLHSSPRSSAVANDNDTHLYVLSSILRILILANHDDTILLLKILYSNTINSTNHDQYIKYNMYFTNHFKVIGFLIHTKTDTYTPIINTHKNRYIHLLLVYVVYNSTPYIRVLYNLYMVYIDSTTIYIY